MSALYQCPECGCRGAWSVYQRYEGCPVCPVRLDRMRTVQPLEEEPGVGA